MSPNVFTILNPYRKGYRLLYIRRLGLIEPIESDELNRRAKPEKYGEPHSSSVGRCSCPTATKNLGQVLEFVGPGSLQRRVHTGRSYITCLFCDIYQPKNISLSYCVAVSATGEVNSGKYLF